MNRNENSKDFKEAINLIRKIAEEGFYDKNQHHNEAVENAYYEILNECMDFLEERGLDANLHS